MNNSKSDYYVYLHRELNGSIFYVGKGRKDRYKNKNNRSIAWKDKASNGYTSEFYRENLTETEALEIEAELIITLDGLTNKNPDSKNLFTKEDYAEYFKINRDSPSGLDRIKGVWNGQQFLGKIGNTGSVDANGYWEVRFKKRIIKVHRIIWTLTNGNILDNQVIDHKDGDTLNNNIENLRSVSKHLNCKNLARRKSNTTSVTGVALISDSGLLRYRVRVKLDDKDLSKSFSVSKYGEAEAFRLACEWRKEQIRLLNEQGAGYTERHGT